MLTIKISLVLIQKADFSSLLMPMITIVVRPASASDPELISTAHPDH